MKSKPIVITVAVIVIAIAGYLFINNRSANDANKAVAQKFYDSFGKTLSVEQLNTFMDPNWLSTGSVVTNSEGTTQWAKTSPGYLLPVPNMTVKVQEMLTEDNRVTVRSIISGTPKKGNFFGVETDGTKSFNIIAIDIHTIENGKIKSSYHVEDWAGAIAQISAK